AVGAAQDGPAIVAAEGPRGAAHHEKDGTAGARHLLDGPCEGQGQGMVAENAPRVRGDDLGPCGRPSAHAGEGPRLRSMPALDGWRPGEHDEAAAFQLGAVKEDVARVKPRWAGRLVGGVLLVEQHE